MNMSDYLQSNVSSSANSQRNVSSSANNQSSPSQHSIPLFQPDGSILYSPLVNGLDPRLLLEAGMRINSYLQRDKEGQYRIDFMCNASTQIERGRIIQTGVILEALQDSYEVAVMLDFKSYEIRAYPRYTVRYWQIFSWDILSIEELLTHDHPEVRQLGVSKAKVLPTLNPS